MRIERSFQAHRTFVLYAWNENFIYPCRLVRQADTIQNDGLIGLNFRQISPMRAESPPCAADSRSPTPIVE